MFKSPWRSVQGRRQAYDLTLGASGNQITYATILRDTYGISEIYPLTNIPVGDTTIYAFVNALRNGVETGWDLKNAAGPVAGGMAPYSDGANDFGNIGAVSTIFTGTVGAAGIFGKVSALADWTDGTNRTLFRYTFNATNYIWAFKHTTLGIRVYFYIGGVLKIVTVSTTTTDWFQLWLTWKDSANGDEAKVFFNGSQSGLTQTGFGAWGGGAIALALIGASNAAPSEVWKGWFAYNCIVSNGILTPAQISGTYADRLNYGPDTNP